VARLAEETGGSAPSRGDLWQRAEQVQGRRGVLNRGRRQHGAQEIKKAKRKDTKQEDKIYGGPFYKFA
jgi:hypothetical protein